MTKQFKCIACKKPLVKGQIVVGFSKTKGAHSTEECMGALGYTTGDGGFDQWVKCAPFIIKTIPPAAYSRIGTSGSV